MRSSLIEKRKAAGLTQEDLAALCGCTSALISRVERGERGGSITLWCSIKDALHLSADEVMQLMKNEEE